MNVNVKKTVLVNFLNENVRKNIPVMKNFERSILKKVVTVANMCELMLICGACK